LSLAACGGSSYNDDKSVFDGSGTGSGNGGNGGNGSGTWTAGVFQPSSSFINKCSAPRTGTDSITGQPFPDTLGTTTDENNFLRSWTNELYLWYQEVPDLNPALYATADYFDLLRTDATTPSGADKDKFHFTYPTAVWEALSGSGQEVGYGLTFALLKTTPPRQAVVAYVDPNAPPATVSAGMARGLEVLTVDGVDLVNVNTQAGVDSLNAGLFPANAGESHTFGVRAIGTTDQPHDVTLVSQNFVSSPVQNVHTIATGTGQVGYIQFNDHVATAEGALKDAVETLKAAGITDLVLDIRYNGGGFLDIASELSYMIAGPTAVAGRTFELQQFNDKHSTTNPVTGDPLTPTPFHTTTLGIQSGLPAGQALQTLDLPRLFVLTGPNTCSASESIINGLRGIDVQVIQIGSTTCGKPYGFYPQDNCGTTYFSIQFRGVNAKDFGDYTDGFTPANTVGTQGAVIPGCSVADDFTHPLGDPAEGRLAAALAYRETGSCAGPPTGVVKAFSANGPAQSIVLHKTPWRENRIMRR
jgi:hypothetical protein